MSEAVTITIPGSPTGTFDEQGNPILGASAVAVVYAKAVAPITPDEVATDSGDVATGGWTLFLPYGTDIPQTATVTVRGEAGYQVTGNAGTVDWMSPYTGRTPGTVAVVRKAS